MGIRPLREGNEARAEKLALALTEIVRVATDALRGCEVQASRTAERTAQAAVSLPEVLFDMNMLAFMKRYGAGLSGDRKFVLLLSYLTRGETSQTASLADTRRHWNKMKGVTGGKFNPAYANRAKANGWIDTAKHGSYKLASDWKRIFD